MTKREMAIVSAYTGYLVGEFDNMHKYIEEKLERPVFTHEMGTPGFMDELRKKAKTDFIGLSKLHNNK